MQLALPYCFETFIENVHAMPKQGTVSMFQFGRSFGACETFFEIYSKELHYVEPRAWKKSLGITSDKQEAIDKADKLWGKQKFWNQRGKHKGRMLSENSGCAEAALIAYYGSIHLFKEWRI